MGVGNKFSQSISGYFKTKRKEKNQAAIKLERGDKVFFAASLKQTNIDSEYRISDMIPVALPPRVAGDGLEDLTSYFVYYKALRPHISVNVKSLTT